MRGDRLQQLRESGGYSRDKLAKLLNIGSASIERYETGKGDATSDVLATFALFFNVSSDYLIGLTDNPNTSIRDTNLGDEELRALELFRSVPPDGKSKILGVLQIMTDKGSTDKGGAGV